MKINIQVESNLSFHQGIEKYPSESHIVKSASFLPTLFYLTNITLVENWFLNSHIIMKRNLNSNREVFFVLKCYCCRKRQSHVFLSFWLLSFDGCKLHWKKRIDTMKKRIMEYAYVNLRPFICTSHVDVMRHFALSN